MNIHNSSIIIGIRQALAVRGLKPQPLAPEVNAARKPVNTTMPWPSKKPAYAALLPAHTELATRRIWYEKLLPK